MFRERLIQHKTRGLSVLELVISLLLLFIASSFLMGMFLSASGAPKRLDKATQLDQVASLKMDEIIASELGNVPEPENGTFPQFPDLRYSVTTQASSFDSNMLVVTVEARDPDGQTRKLVALKPNRAPIPPPPPPVPLPATLTVDLVDDEGDPVGPPPVLPPPPAIEANECMSCHGFAPVSAPAWARATLIANASAAGLSPVAYIVESIFEPSAFIVDGYGYPSDPNNANSPEFSLMEGWEVEMSQAEAVEIANWLLSEGTNYDQPFPPEPWGEEALPALPNAPSTF